MRVFNFAAGPAVLPEDVLAKAGAEMSDYKGSGMSVMEMSHRSKVYQQIFDTAEEALRKALQIPEGYKVLFLQGGASTQFAMIPLNLATKGKAAYVNTGAWSKKAIEEAKRYIDTDVIASSADKNFTYIPEVPAVDQSLDYLHITTNNTIFGTKFSRLPNTGNVPLVADMSSNIASEVMDMSRFALVYAGAQKNLGPAGATIVVIRDDLLERAPNEITPTMLRYTTHSENGSMFNTPPCYTIYIIGLVLEWILAQGGVAAVEKANREKAAMLYDFIDQSGFYSSPVRKEDRSLMNVPFILADSALDADFLSQATAAGLVNLKGHRSVGGMRASIYNAMPKEGVAALVDFMKDFEKKRG